MPATASTTTDQLIALGQQIRAHRKTLRISATTAAKAAGMSRVTLHRIEKGVPTVTMGAYVNAIIALGLNFGLVAPAELIEFSHEVNRSDWIPARIRQQEYPQLKLLAWQLHGAKTLSPLEAWNIYERNWRYMDEQALTTDEQQLIDALRVAFGSGDSHV